MQVRVYYEDTDHGGVVYYANYLKFMERGRTELLRQYGLDLQHLAESYGIQFAVTSANIEYPAPAKFNDLLEVESQIIHLHGARIVFKQTVWRLNADTGQHEQKLAVADIHLACINPQQKAQRIPKTIIESLTCEEKHYV
ncbi:MAG: tol-pal system-associated acyl-CoA thioesterase [Zetaproteobacteria bacterium]|nr:tol-pal system-associated acyl-CoA thioesterase [Zetaproteobacteria bacterium]